jgi:alkylated DNA nucleotide flippase Atl1
MVAMRARGAAALAAAFLTLAAVSLRGWGFDVHRELTRRTLQGLPPELKAFFNGQRDFIVEHTVDPDLWRVVGLKSDRGEEDPNHFLDIDGLGDPPPFKNVPREWPAFVAKYGTERANRAGRLPWRAEEIYQLLVARFRDVAKGTPAYAADNARYLAAILGHYVQDAHQPFHAVANYDGQLTNQRGIHSRFETDLVLRNLGGITWTEVGITPIASFRDFMFDTIVASASLAAGVLEADRKAAAEREFYDDPYFAAFFAGARPVLNRRLNDAAAAHASAIVAAWTEAGKPVLPAPKPPGPARIRR